MRRTIIGLCVLLLACPAALAQSASIRWGQDVRAAIEQAEKSDLPLMFWIIGSSSDRAEMEDTERDQIRAFGNRQVVELSKRFVCCKMSMSQHRKDVQKWQALNFEIVFATANGDKIDSMPAGGATNADTLAQKMRMVSASFAQTIYDRDIKPVLENDKATPKELRAALDSINKLDIRSADSDVLALLRREGVDPAVASRCIEVLGGLATRPAVEELFERAATDKKAADSLKKSPPVAAGLLVEHLTGNEPAKRLLAYELITAICKIKDAKQDAFWNGTNEKIKTDEINRVKKIAEKAADKWREQNPGR